MPVFIVEEFNFWYLIGIIVLGVIFAGCSGKK